MEQSFFSSGTTQKDRTPEVLLPDYVNVEEKTISDYLNFIQNFSGITQFWNIYNYKQGNFQEFFKDDLSFVLAAINTVDLNPYPLKFSALTNAFPQIALTSEKEQNLVELLLLNLELAKLLESWYSKICNQVNPDGSPNEIEVMVREIIESNLWNVTVSFTFL